MIYISDLIIWMIYISDLIIWMIYILFLNDITNGVFVLNAYYL